MIGEKWTSFKRDIVIGPIMSIKNTNKREYTVEKLLMIFGMLFIAIIGNVLIPTFASLANKNGSYSATMNQLAQDLEDNLEANFAWTIKSKGKDEREKFINFKKLYPLIDKAKGAGEKRVQDDFNQLAQVYQALNYADMAALQLLRKSCLDDGLFHPKTDPVLCKNYPKQLIKFMEARVGMINSYTLYSDDILKVPPGWIEHAREILKLLESDRDGNVRAYVLQNLLIKAFKDRADGRAPEDYVPEPANSPLRLIQSAQPIVYTPGLQTSMPVTIAPEPYFNDAPPVVAPNYAGGVSNPNSQQQGQPIQVVNGQVISPGQFNTATIVPNGSPLPCNSSNNNVIAIPVMPITALNVGTSIMGINMNVPQAKSFNIGSHGSELNCAADDSTPSGPAGTLQSNTPTKPDSTGPISGNSASTAEPVPASKPSVFSRFFKSSKDASTPPSQEPKKKSIFSLF